MIPIGPVVSVVLLGVDELFPGATVAGNPVEDGPLPEGLFGADRAHTVRRPGCESAICTGCVRLAASLNRSSGGVTSHSPGPAGNG